MQMYKLRSAGRMLISETGLFSVTQTFSCIKKKDVNVECLHPGYVSRFYSVFKPIMRQATQWNTNKHPRITLQHRDVTWSTLQHALTFARLMSLLQRACTQRSRCRAPHRSLPLAFSTQPRQVNTSFTFSTTFQHEHSHPADSTRAASFP